ALVAALAVLAGYAAATAPQRLGQPFVDTARHGWRTRAQPVPGVRLATLPEGGIRAARWVRAHARPGDVVATNAHCRSGDIRGRCDSRHFWVAAYTERRVLVEGWGYTAGAHAQAARTGRSHAVVPYWRPELLAANEALFRAPSPAAADRLRRAYGVRWLLVDLRVQRPPAGLGRVAALRLRVGRCAVYELSPAGAPAP
ncbi:MAG TPA: hypothetical protein VES42_11255, partial [Pilimelia sp.]|nr:hypothetical protein [Pilimelia sp.]